MCSCDGLIFHSAFVHSKHISIIGTACFREQKSSRNLFSPCCGTKAGDRDVFGSMVLIG